MPSQTILWVALPDGFSDESRTRARLSVFVSPRLQPDGDARLAPFGFLDWPARLAAGQVEFDLVCGDARLAATVVARPESRLWRALFDPETLVRSHERVALSPVFASFPAGRLHDELRAGYQNAYALSPHDVPAAHVVATAFADVGEALRAPAGGVREGSGGERDERLRLARGLVLPASPAAKEALGEELVGLARREAVRRSNGGRPSFVPLVPDDGTARSAFEQFAAFHHQPRGPRRGGLRDSSAPADRLDFHELLTSLGEYPGLLRRLGLVVDLDVDAAGLAEASDDAPGRLRVVPRFTAPFGVATSLVSPDTAYAFARGRRFQAAGGPDAGPRDVVEGLLDLRLRTADGSPQFRLLEIDVDGAALGAVDLLGSAPPAGPSSDGSSLRALRTAGISIVRRGQAELLHDAIASGTDKIEALLSGRESVLFAEDLVRGYRIDVHDATSRQWRSLHQREGRFTFERLQDPLTIVDEGCVQPCLVRHPAHADAPASPGAEPPNRVGESLFLWNGWSLSATRPGKTLPKPRPRPGAEPPPPDPAGALPLQTAFRPVPHSLPRLRFGESYRLRARTVDLAGNALSLERAQEVVETLGADAPVLPGAGDDFRFLRFEAVGTPVLVPRAERQEGDTLERIVVRSTRDLTVEQFTASQPVFLHAGERHIAPPRTFQLMAEMLGRFDASIASGKDLGGLFDLATRGKGDGDEDVVHPEPRLALDYLPDPLTAGAVFRGLPGVPEGTIGRVRDGRLEFAPIPLPAAEVGSLVQIDFGDRAAWPALAPFRLRLDGGETAPRWDDAERVLTVFLPPGLTRTVRLASTLRDAHDLGLLGIAQWMEDWLREQVARGKMEPAALPGRLEEWRQRSLLGLSWMLTPYRELTLVHAAEQPVAPEILSFPQPLKVIGQTFAYVRGKVRVHAASTGRLDLRAEWKESEDGPGAPAGRPGERPCHAQVFPAPFHLTADAPPVPRGSEATTPIPEATFDAATGTVEYIAPRLEEIHDSLVDRHAALSTAISLVQGMVAQLGPSRRALAQAVALLDSGPVGSVIQLSPLLARWPDIIALAEEVRVHVGKIVSEAEEGPQVDAPAGQEPIGPLPPDVATAVHRVGTRAEEISSIAQSALRGKHRGRHEFGDTKHRRVTYRAVATSVHADAFPAAPGDAPTSIVDASAPVTVDVMSSARPDPPRVHHIVPAFSWTRTGGPQASTRESRRRGGLRVFLDRPWFSSGEGELLAVVLGPDPGSEGFDEMEPFATQWGRDPLWRSSPTSARLTPDHFRNAAAVREGVRLSEEAARFPVTLVGHQVDYDDDGRCFCDIELDPGDAYFPFVRLALARYQPSSVPTVEVSRVVRADFAQLVPDRSVAVAALEPGLFRVAVTGRTHLSPAEPFVPEGPHGTTIGVSVQRRIPGTTDDLGWVRAGDDAVVTTEVEASGEVLWLGLVRLPAARGPFRVLVEEVERLLGLATDGAEGRVPRNRVVYAEAFELSS